MRTRKVAQDMKDGGVSEERVLNEVGANGEEFS